MSPLRLLDITESPLTAWPLIAAFALVVVFGGPGDWLLRNVVYSLVLGH